MRTKLLGITPALVAWLAAAVSGQAQLIFNGGFELGLAGWTTADQTGSDGTFSIQTGTASAVNGIPVPQPPQGVQAAMSDAQGPGSHVLFQDFVVPIGLMSGTATFSLFVGNQAENFSVPSPESLDFGTTALNQQARVDLMLPSADPFSVAAGDILQNLFLTPAGPAVYPTDYTDYSVDVSSVLQANQGKTLRLRIAEVDNVNIFNLGVDRVSIGAVDRVPESTAWWLILPLLGCLVVHSWGRRAQLAPAYVDRGRTAKVRR